MQANGWVGAIDRDPPNRVRDTPPVSGRAVPASQPLQRMDPDVVVLIEVSQHLEEESNDTQVAQALEVYQHVEP
jgi:hypothetical protein